MGAVLPAECERARSRASLELDGELSQVELALQRAHIGRCAACVEFARDLNGLTQELRTTPLQRPLVVAMPARRRSPGMRALQLGAAAAAVAIAAGLGSLAGSLTSRHGRPTSVGAPRFAALAHPQPLRGTRFQQRVPV
jgi:predicted anti-sigma-YlaC factor YlaD